MLTVHEVCFLCSHLNKGQSICVWSRNFDFPSYFPVCSFIHLISEQTVDAHRSWSFIFWDGATYTEGRAFMCDWFAWARNFDSPSHIPALFSHSHLTCNFRITSWCSPFLKFSLFSVGETYPAEGLCSSRERRTSYPSQGQPHCDAHGLVLPLRRGTLIL